MNTQDQQRFNEIRHRLERATPGPHTMVAGYPEYHCIEIVAMAGTPEEAVIADLDTCGGVTCGGVSPEQNAANAEFFAHSHEDITWLTERLRDRERALAQTCSRLRELEDGLQQARRKVRHA